MTQCKHKFTIGDWCWFTRQASPCRVIERQDVWGEVAYRVWLPAKDAVVRARAVDLASLESVRPSVEQILHTTAAAKLLDALEDNLLLAPIQFIEPSELAAFRNFYSPRPLGEGPGVRESDQENLWRMHDQVICSLDSVKPMESRRGWSLEQLNTYNRERFEDLISASWDLVIIDEAHRMGGSTEQVARDKLGAALAEASPYLLLLSATPHQGKTDQFMRLMQLLDREAFPDEGSVSRDRVRPFVIRTEKRASINISTDAGGEGLNLQFCHVIVNFDMPWNPMRIEQRIGRVDRIGQKHVVRAINFVLEDTVEHRVRQALEEKLEIIAQEFGVDKAADVMDSVEVDPIFDELFVQGLQNPETIEQACDAVVSQLRSTLVESKQNSDLLTTEHDLDADDARKWRDHPSQFWLERAITNGLAARGGSAAKVGKAWRVKWADGSESAQACFDARTADENPELEWVTMEDPRARAVISELPRFVVGQPLPVIRVTGLPDSVRGIWSLWEEHATRMAALDDMETSVPDLNAVMMVRVGGSVIPAANVTNEFVTKEPVA